jgi:hypothetical protein
VSSTLKVAATGFSFRRWQPLSLPCNVSLQFVVADLTPTQCWPDLAFGWILLPVAGLLIFIGPTAVCQYLTDEKISFRFQYFDTKS